MYSLWFSKSTIDPIVLDGAQKKQSYNYLDLYMNCFMDESVPTNYAHSVYQRLIVMTPIRPCINATMHITDSNFSAIKQEVMQADTMIKCMQNRSLDRLLPGVFKHSKNWQA